MERVILIAAALYGVYSIWQAWVTGTGTPNGGIKRDEQPVLYWAMMVVAALMTSAFLYFAAFWDY